MRLRNNPTSYLLRVLSSQIRQILASQRFKLAETENETETKELNQSSLGPSCEVQV